MLYLLTVSVVRMPTTRNHRLQMTQLSTSTTPMTPEPTDPCLLLSCRYLSRCVVSDDRRTARCQCPTMLCGNSSSNGPVCGSDDNDYADECEMKSRSCSEQRSITKKYNGFCGMLHRYIDTNAFDDNGEICSRLTFFFCWSTHLVEKIRTNYNAQVSRRSQGVVLSSIIILIQGCNYKGSESPEPPTFEQTPQLFARLLGEVSLSSWGGG